MEKALVSHQGVDVCAWEHEGRWTVQLGAYEASSSYLDLALSELLGSGEGVHELAARLVAELANTRSVGADEAVRPNLGAHDRTAESGSLLAVGGGE